MVFTSITSRIWKRHGDRLHSRGIIYAPDYVINSGGLINVSAEVEGWDLERSHRKASEIYDTILRVLQIAENQFTDCRIVLIVVDVRRRLG